MESMRKDMSDLVEMEIAEKEAEFAQVEKEFSETKEVLKDAQGEVDRLKKEGRALAAQAKVDKKHAAELAREATYAKARAEESDRELRRNKRAEEERHAETEQLHRDNESYRQELAYIQQTYQLDTVEEKMRSAQKTESWAEHVLQELTQLFHCVEQFLTCTICNNVMTHEGKSAPVMVLPCQHTFCSDCQSSKVKQPGRCACCAGPEKSLVENTAMTDLADKYHYFKAPLVKRMDWMKLRVSKNFKV